MATQPLLTTQIERGRQTLLALDAARLDIRAAFWLYDDNSDEWKFTVGVPSATPDKIHSLYGRIRIATQERPDGLPLRDIHVVAPDHPLVRLTRQFITTGGSAIDNISLSGNVINGFRLPDMHLYRMA